MPRVQPTTYTAGRRVRLEGVLYERGQVVPGAVVRRLRRLSAFLSRRWLIPDVDPSRRRTPLAVPTPTALTPRERSRIP